MQLFRFLRDSTGSAQTGWVIYFSIPDHSLFTDPVMKREPDYRAGSARDAGMQATWSVDLKKTGDGGPVPFLCRYSNGATRFIAYWPDTVWLSFGEITKLIVTAAAEKRLIPIDEADVIDTEEADSLVVVPYGTWVPAGEGLDDEIPKVVARKPSHHCIQTTYSISGRPSKPPKKDHIDDDGIII
ncbi:hypothetical protein LZ30DRAFT_689363 [Colletotrichum cereale]|nr:hypothetical protein LZ30DRAFT_689363 [Colletotrichum cereale]